MKSHTALPSVLKRIPLGRLSSLPACEERGLRPLTIELLTKSQTKNLIREELSRLNRLLLEDAYPVGLWRLTNTVEIEPSGKQTASEQLALSYFHQAQRKLDQALTNATNATRLAPNLSYAWARRAELELANGQVDYANRDSEKAVSFGRSNVHAYVVRGFVLADKGHIDAALTNFDKAIQLNYRVGDAWVTPLFPTPATHFIKST
jgi:tetratricopeptide (TPR) repeat protein